MKILACSVSTVVEHSTPDLEIKGSNSAVAQHKEITAKQK
jgi:hypothetical protein